MEPMTREEHRKQKNEYQRLRRARKRQRLETEALLAGKKGKAGKEQPVQRPGEPPFVENKAAGKTNGDGRHATKTSFKKGVSGNPAGVPKDSVAKGEGEPVEDNSGVGITKKVGKNKVALEALRVALHKMDGVILRKLQNIIISKYFNKARPDVVIRAAELVWAYEYGKPRTIEDEVDKKGRGAMDFLLFLQKAHNALQLMGGGEHGGAFPAPRPSWVPRPVFDVTPKKEGSA